MPGSSWTRSLYVARTEAEDPATANQPAERGGFLVPNHRSSLPRRIRDWVLAGYGGDDDVAELVAEVRMDFELSDSEGEALLADGCTALREHPSREAEWHGPTASDRLTAAFAALGHLGILTVENVGFTMPEGWANATIIELAGGGRGGGGCWNTGVEGWMGKCRP